MARKTYCDWCGKEGRVYDLDTPAITRWRRGPTTTLGEMCKKCIDELDERKVKV